MADRLISADALIGAISKMAVPYGDGTYPGDYAKMVHDETLYDVLETIHEAPTVDAVEVVRCKDCKHWIQYPNLGTNACKLHKALVVTNADTYCSYGERKDNG